MELNSVTRRSKPATLAPGKKVEEKRRRLEPEPEVKPSGSCRQRESGSFNWTTSLAGKTLLSSVTPGEKAGGLWPQGLVLLASLFP